MLESKASERRPPDTSDKSRDKDKKAVADKNGKASDRHGPKCSCLRCACGLRPRRGRAAQETCEVIKIGLTLLNNYIKKA